MPTMAELRAARAARPSPVLVPNDDKDELVGSFRRPVGGREAGAPALVEGGDLPAVGAPASTALDPSRPLRGARVAVVDVETTGIDPLTCEIVEIAVVLVAALGESEPEVVLHTRVRPTQPIPAEATKVHGISDADVAEAPTWAEVAPRVREALDGAIPCAFNASFDGQVLREMVPWGAWLDPFVLVRGLDQFEKGKTLVESARRRGIVLNAHGAAGDALVTAMLLPVLVREAVVGARDRRGVVRFQAPPHPTVGGYLAWQRERALEQERDLIAFFARSGRPFEATWHRLEGVAPPVAALPAPRTAQCQSCSAPVLWIVTQGGRAHPVDPPQYRIVPQPADPADPGAWTAYNAHPGKARSVWLDGGTLQMGKEDEAGPLWGRESHFSTCPHASRHRGGSRE